MDSTSSSTEVVEALDKYDIWLIAKDKEALIYDSICQKFKPEVFSQIEENNSKKKHDSKQIPALQKVIRYTNRKWRHGSTSISNPIFFAEGFG